jgi:hypothetical protein
MQRFALGAKCGNPGKPPTTSARAPFILGSSDASASAPMPCAAREKKRRRVSSTAISVARSPSRRRFAIGIASGCSGRHRRADGSGTVGTCFPGGERFAIEPQRDFSGEQWPSSSGSLAAVWIWIGGPSFIEYLVEIQKLAGEHGERGMFGGRERWIGLALAIVQEFARVFGVSAVVALEIVVRRRAMSALVGGERARQHARAM